MASVASTVTTANAIRDYFGPGFQEGLYRNDFTLNMLRAIGFQDVTAPGGLKYQWHLNSSGNSNVGVFTENQGAPASVAQGWIRPAVSWTYYWGFVTVSGMARDALADGGLFDAVSAEVSLTQRDITDLRNTTLLGATQNGLQAAISATTTYAGITRGSAAYFESATSSTATIAGLKALHRAIRDPEHGGTPTAILLSPTALEVYLSLGTMLSQTQGSSNNLLRYVQPANGTAPAFDLGHSLTGNAFMGAPVIGVPDLTSTVVIFLDTSGATCKHIVVRPFQVKFHHNEGDNEVYEISCGSTIAVENPVRSGIMTSFS